MVSSTPLEESAPLPCHGFTSISLSLYRCHHCHEVLKVLNEVAEAVRPHGIFMAKVDIEENKSLKRR